MPSLHMSKSRSMLSKDAPSITQLTAMDMVLAHEKGPMSVAQCSAT